MRRFRWLPSHVSSLVLPCLAVTALAVAACGEDTAGITEDGGGETEGTTGSVGSTGSVPVVTETDTEAVGSSTGEPVPEFEPYPARGITLVEAYANQGVSVPILSAGAQWVDGSGRNAVLVKGRNTLIRGYWQLDPDFEPRELEAKLTLFFSDGTTEEASKRIMVERDSVATDLDTNAWFVVPGELIEEQMKFQIELLETDWGYEELPEPEHVGYPTEPSYLGIESTDMRLEVVLVPVDHDLGPECPEPPVIDEAALEWLSNALYQQNPVQEVELSVRDTWTYTSSMNSFSPLLGALAELRAADNAPADVYYYGLVRPCDGGADGVGGQAISIPNFPSQDNAWTRVAMGRFYSSLTSTAETFVHEIGHTQGRAHIYCNGSEGGTDPTYPYEAGDIGTWGFGVLDFSLHTPTNAKDYMTYCGNTWVSDWGWQKVVPFIEEITSWDLSAEPAPEQNRLLVGLFDDDGVAQSWFVTSGSTWGRAANPADVFEIEGPDGSELVASTLEPMGDGGYNVVVELPPNIPLHPDAVEITRIRNGQRHRVELRQ